jgi:protein-disulfide isomerase
MASRKEQKEQARARRLAEEQQRAERQRQQRRLRTVIGSVAVAVIIIVLAIVITSSGGSSGLKKGAQATQTVAQVSSLLNGIPENGATLGNPSAPVTMVYYGDLECPICRDFTVNGGFSQLISNEVRSGKVKVVYRAFQTATQSQQTFQTQQVAALAAGKQNRFWYFTELFYHEQGQEGTNYVTESYLDGLARQVPGLNLTAWQQARNDASLASQVQSEIHQGTSQGVNGTPTLIFQGPKGQPVATSGVPAYSELKQLVNKVS